MKIAIGSQNPVKRQAVEHVLSEQFDGAMFITVAVSSGVSDQPFGDEETRRGAVNRARAALQQATTAAFGVGLEGGVQETEFGLLTCAWCAIVDADGRTGVGGSSCVQLPPTVADMIRDGAELGAAMDHISGASNTKHGLGAIGLLTDALLTRQTAYEYLIKLALAPFIRNDWYQ
jgi:inosine/xanthosine triphosphatase